MHQTIAEIIEEWLIREDRTQVQLARKARISPATLTRVIRGKQPAKAKVCRRLEMAMGLASGTLEAAQTQAPLPLSNNGKEA